MLMASVDFFTVEDLIRIAEAAPRQGSSLQLLGIGAVLVLGIAVTVVLLILRARR